MTRYVEVKYRITGRRKRTHRGYVVQDDPLRASVDYLFFYTEDRLYKQGRLVSFWKTIPRKAVLHVTDLSPPLEESKEFARLMIREIKNESNLLQSYIKFLNNIGAYFNDDKKDTTTS